MLKSTKNMILLPIGNKIEDVKQIGSYIRTKRKKLGLTQADAADLCNTGTRFLSDLENGKATIQIGKALKVMRAFGIDVYIQDREAQ